ncbi:DNA-directed RNA polymerase sigma-70 factor [Actinoplanes sp. NBRC 14428]|uniref:RNA polymerase sigma factor n=1 Tax=Pseudosporangium ferrugineum TaxID=439699 RepID=A0A2T0RQL9_9ACTN|nr:RNA polymerase sigma factor [Pseudosporangium ferrugineum]PRY23417.1 RNA polymerase sigma-70 factor (ECF subfamily) [Pseudosporangium ferrugineum]BCJ55420.1 DNA-directed RNA polymerase sigma-70 factor [Actinoplanes sp. NBRC 14428]
MARRVEPGGDAELLRLVAAGDAAALARLYERHAGALFGYLQRLAGDRMTAEEILQDTMLAVWRSAGAFEGRAKVTTWLFGVARRQAHNRLRGRAAPLPAGAELPDRPDGGAGPEELAIAAAGGTPVAAAIDRLPEHHREVIALVFVAGLPLADVAEVLAVPVGTVKSRLFHARAAVAAALTEKVAE